ncbi:NADH-quinone oxidoreductase subunit C [Kosmotoga sp.]|uniref:NADH-quinone oxidoreductase subunit C n=1 Tax=Kosmotoga sp. TaxID=1955248 RepID=UPI0024AAF276|nr:NADH-quinone oxidoreductase subunit C [Kosmotoga sp.]MDI3523664.1 hypothetical protein [Kosmotoga sp.]
MNPIERKKELFAAIQENIELLSEKRKRIYFKVDAKNIINVAKILFTRGLRLSTITAVENIETFELIYHFSDDLTGCYYCPKVFVHVEKPVVPSIAKIIEGASWIEREIHELFGVGFIDHPGLKPLLTENNEKIPKKPLRVERKKHE